MWRVVSSSGHMLGSSLTLKSQYPHTNSSDLSPYICLKHYWREFVNRYSGTSIERFSHDLEMKTREQNRNNTYGNRAVWLVYQTDTNVRGFWLVKRTHGWKNFMPENFLEINRYFALTSYCNTIGQSNNAFSKLGFSLAGKRRVHVLIFSSIGWSNK